LQGLTARWVATLLQVNRHDEASGAVIIGCHPLSRLIARLFQERGESVVLIDTDSEACETAEQENLPVIQSSGLDIEALEEAGLDSMGTFLAMTTNGEVNFVLAQRAVEEFQPPRVLAVFSRDPQANPPKNKTKVSQAFIPQLSIKTWNQYLRDGQVKLGKTVLKEPGFAFQQAHLQALIRAGELVPLLLERESSFQIVSSTEAWQTGDQIIYLLHDPRPKLLKRLSGASASSRLALEKLPEVEEVPISAPVEEKAIAQVAKPTQKEVLQPPASG
jgi:Trk K+ transport system NAD-binding subunit